MVAITGMQLSRRNEYLALSLLVLGMVAAVVVPVLYVVVVPVVCAGGASVAPTGRRMLTAMAMWVPVSAAVLLSGVGSW